MQDIEDRKKNVYSAAIFDENLLIVRCGRYIKYGYFDDDIWDNDDV